MEEVEEMKEKGVVQEWAVIVKGFLCVCFFLSDPSPIIGNACH